MSSLITNTQCPVMHFAQAMPDKDDVSINIFGAGSDISGTYLSTMALCQFNTKTSSWKQIIRPDNAPPARRNAALETTQSGLTVIWGMYTCALEIFISHYSCFILSASTTT